MLAERFPGILPDLGDTEVMEVAAIHSLCSLLTDSVQLVRRPLFEAPQCDVALVGGRSGLPVRGPSPRANRGVFFSRLGATI